MARLDLHRAHRLLGLLGLDDYENVYGEGYAPAWFWAVDAVRGQRLSKSERPRSLYDSLTPKKDDDDEGEYAHTRHDLGYRSFTSDAYRETLDEDAPWLRAVVTKTTDESPVVRAWWVTALEDDKTPLYHYLLGLGWNPKGDLFHPTDPKVGVSAYVMDGWLRDLLLEAADVIAANARVWLPEAEKAERKRIADMSRSYSGRERAAKKKKEKAPTAELFAQPEPEEDPDAVFCDECEDGPLKSGYETADDGTVKCGACLNDAALGEGGDDDDGAGAS